MNKSHNRNAARQRSSDTSPARAPQPQRSRRDADAINSSRDELQISSSSTVEAFGESRPIWREESASRKEPPSTKGKKRSSEEYEEDELQASFVPRLSQGSFTAIDLFDDDARPPKSKKVLTQPPKQRNAKSPGLREQPGAPISTIDPIFDDDLNSPSTLGRLPKVKSPASSAVSQSQPSKKYFKKEAESPRSETKSQARRRWIIADSEDEDDSFSETLPPNCLQHLRHTFQPKLYRSLKSPGEETDVQTRHPYKHF